MNRHRCTPRENWEKKVVNQGVSYARIDGFLYWDESVAYDFTAEEIDVIERVTNELHRLCLEAGQTIIERKWYGRLGLAAGARELIEASWKSEAPSLYGRFDLAYDGRNPPKLLEYNADTPTALVEAAVAQWFWLKDTRPQADQFNSIHERLIAAWQSYARKTGATRVHLCALRESLEDNQTTMYLEDTLRHAGLPCQRLAVEDIGWDGKQFVDLDRDRIGHLFKLYPWEWLLADPFANHLSDAGTAFIEPAWKMMFSSKGLLPILWELYPGHPNLLPAFTEFRDSLGGSYVRKPLLGREGSNIELFLDGRPAESTPGPYGDEGYVYQQLAPRTPFDGQYPVLGSWIVEREAAGMGIREDSALISTNTSRFVPHWFQ